jgi:hypothetical protein
VTLQKEEKQQQAAVVLKKKVGKNGPTHNQMLVLIPKLFYPLLVERIFYK